MSAESQRQRPTDDDQQLEHVPIVAAAGARINSDEFWRGSLLTRVERLHEPRTPKVPLESRCSTSS